MINASQQASQYDAEMAAFAAEDKAREDRLNEFRSMGRGPRWLRTDRARRILLLRLGL